MLQRIKFCRQFCNCQYLTKPSLGWIRNSHNVSYHRMPILRNSNVLDPYTKQNPISINHLQHRSFYSTSTNPQMSRSLQKWKKKKRKSKGQLKKELDGLKQDLVQLLTKRAIQLVRNPSARDDHRWRVVSSHFSSRPDLKIENNCDALPPNFSDFSHVKCNVNLSHELNSHIVNFHETHHNREASGGLQHIQDLFNQDTSSCSNSMTLETCDIQEHLENQPPFLEGKTNPSSATATTSTVNFDFNQSDTSISAQHNCDVNPGLESLTSDSTNRNVLNPLGEGSLRLDVSDGLEGLKNKKEEMKEKKKTRTRKKSSKKISSEHAVKKPDHKKEKKSLHGQSKAMAHVNVNQDFQDLMYKSYSEACCFSGHEHLAIRHLEFQSTTNHPTSVEVFNKLVHSLAKKRDLGNIKLVFSLMKQQHVTPTLQIYAGCLECLGRMPDADTILCERILRDAELGGLDIAEVANVCSFESDEWDYVLKAIKMVLPDFIPNPAMVSKGYEKGVLSGLNKSRTQLPEMNQYALDMTKSNIVEKFAQQLEMEKKGVVEVESICSLSAKRSTSAKLKKIRKETMDEWRKVLCEAFKSKLLSFEKQAHDNMSLTLFPYLKLFPPEDYVEIIFKILQELFTSSEGYSPTQVVLQASLGRLVNRKYNSEAKVAAGMGHKMAKLYDQYMDFFLDDQYPLDNQRTMFRSCMVNQSDTINMDMSFKKWPQHVMKGIGKVLLDLILYDLKIDANALKNKSEKRMVQAFCTIYRPDFTMYTMAEIKLHPILMKLFKPEFTEPMHFDPSTVPMLAPPVPWISKNMGGLVLSSNTLIRMGVDMHYMDVLKHVDDDNYKAVLDSLNTLSACAWKVNKPILDLQIKMFNNKGDAALKVAPPSSELPPLPSVKAEMTGKEKGAVYRERVQMQQQKQDMHGLWCSDLYRLSIANKFRDEVFWFPHNLDFRGRTYPMPPHFNHLGSDNVRGMLLFAKGKPLGEQGQDWLKIHLVNLTGLRKRCSNAERLEFAETLMPEVLDSADNPLTGNQWWRQSEEPWQTLACCVELTNIERFTGNKEDYISHFPTHQDGSCNGLQHYAALGRDQKGAESVNLYPFEEPQDVYSDVVEMVERERQKDAAGGHQLAQVLDGFIKRKVIKQTIMTTVYGVTKYGAKAQIHKQLKDIPDFPPDQAWKASFYLTDKTFQCLREKFTATKDIQDWLTDAAHIISAFAPVDWITPLGFPVLQTYFARLKGTKSNKFTNKPNGMKQKNAFPPNYIHSLDSTHMMLTSLFCMHAGITFVSVHDCFWTHACDIPIMNSICREQFVNMHNLPLLEDLSKHLLHLVEKSSRDPELVEQMKFVDLDALNGLLLAVPRRGHFNLDNVLQSMYFFS